MTIRCGQTAARAAAPAVSHNEYDRFVEKFASSQNVNLMSTTAEGNFLIVRMVKPQPDARLGMLLVCKESPSSLQFQPPRVDSMKVGGLAHQSALRVGDFILTVNGQVVSSDDDASEKIALAESEILLGVERPMKQEPQATVPPAQQGGPLTANNLIANLAKLFGCAGDCGVCGVGAKPSGRRGGMGK